MIDFIKQGDQLLMRYVPERGDDNWLVQPLESDDEIPLSGRTLFVRREIYRPEIDDGEFIMDACYRFAVGFLVSDYYQIDRRFLGIGYDLFMHRHQQHVSGQSRAHARAQRHHHARGNTVMFSKL